jgi:hypothetical protein
VIILAAFLILYTISRWNKWTAPFPSRTTLCGFYDIYILNVAAYYRQHSLSSLALQSPGHAITIKECFLMLPDASWHLNPVWCSIPSFSPYCGMVWATSSSCQNNITAWSSKDLVCLSVSMERVPVIPNLKVWSQIILEVEIEIDRNLYRKDPSITNKDD